MKDGRLTGNLGDVPLALHSSGTDSFEALIVPGMQWTGKFEIEDVRVVGLDMDADGQRILFQKQGIKTASGRGDTQRTKRQAR